MLLQLLFFSTLLRVSPSLNDIFFLFENSFRLQNCLRLSHNPGCSNKSYFGRHRRNFFYSSYHFQRFNFTVGITISISTDFTGHYPFLNLVEALHVVDRVRFALYLIDTIPRFSGLVHLIQGSLNWTADVNNK